MPSAPAIRDQIGSPRLYSLRRLAVRQIDRVQGEAPSDQLVATALAVVVMAEAIRMDPHELLNVAKRVVKDAEGPFTHQIQALRDYAQAELTSR